MSMTVRSLRRYPVKSMGGESLDRVDVDGRGLAGDRWFAVVDDEGHFASGKNTRRFRRRDAVFDYAASTRNDGQVLVTHGAERWLVGAPQLDAQLTSAMGVPVRVAPESGVPHQDMASVSLIGSATLAWCREQWGLDVDPRRLRVNIVFESSEPFTEESWTGRTVAIGSTTLTLGERVPRCRMIDIDQDGATAEGRLLRQLGQERDLCLAMYADVAAPGVIRVGDGLVVS